jgi:hypothetical protein
MIGAIDFYRGAKILIDHNGDQAESVAMKRAEAFKSKGSLDGLGVWTRIAGVIKALQRTKRMSGEVRT